MRFIKKLFLKFSQNSQQNTYVGVAGLRPATLLKLKLQHKFFPVNFANIFKNT